MIFTQPFSINPNQSLRVRDVSLSKTILDSEQVGDQIVNTACGVVYFQSGELDLTVTNNLTNTSSLVFAWLMGIDDTMEFIKAVTVQDGSFTVYPNVPPTSNVKVGFLVFN